MDALDRESFEIPREYQGLMEAAAAKCRADDIIDLVMPLDFSRHCDEYGNFIHMLGDINDRNHCTQFCSAGHHLYIGDRRHVMEVEFRRGTPIQLPESVVPIFAGSDIDGRRLFMATAVPMNRHCGVPMGTKPEDIRFRDHQNRVVTPTSISLYVLRYAADTYPPLLGHDEFMVGDDAGIDATGPYSWKFLKHLLKIEEILG